MATTDKLQGSDGEENSKKDQLKMKCCAKEQAVFVCVNCFRVLHKSCAKRMSGLKIINENPVECCDGEYIGDNRKLEIMELSKQQVLMENHYLKQLLAEVQDKNNVLAINNSLLLDKIKTMETEKNITKNTTQMKPQSLGRRPAPSYAKVATSVEGKLITPFSPCDKLTTRKQMAQRKQNSLTTVTVMTDDNVTNEDITVLSGSQNQNNQTSDNEHDKIQVDSDGWKNAKTKRKLTRSKGEADNLEGRFKGENPRAWLYLYRIKPEVSEEDILE
ncbi:hypothetical protein JTB14_012660 [Gonioctena quinquepunctata]|nr:hypothetical protein JTB14_012660 [Gonioctena quinquepunctata]